MEASRSLPLMEMFPTIQGEGYYQGKAAFFVRLAGCDVGCSWCDVKESWPVDEHPHVAIESIISEAKKYPARMAVITGGEPAMHDLSLLTKRFREEGFSTHMETSGAHPLTGTWDWITLSPKKFMDALPEYFDCLHELKVVVVNRPDLAWAEKMASKIGNSDTALFLQPEWSRSETVVPMVVDYILTNPKWKISLQIHKFMNIP